MAHVEITARLQAEHQPDIYAPFSQAPLDETGRTHRYLKCHLGILLAVLRKDVRQQVVRYAFISSDPDDAMCGMLKIADMAQDAVGIHGDASHVICEQFARLGEHHTFSPPFE